MHFSTLVSGFLLASLTSAISCNSTNQCPEDKPCCSQYGECGTGSYCVNGCNIKNSFNLTSCAPMPRMKSFDTVFDSKDGLTLQTSYLGNVSEGDWLYSGWIDTNDDALLFEMPKNSGGSVISSTHYLWYGRISATLKTSHLPGVVTSFILYSDVEDEIDFEFVGNNMTNAQSNWYSQGKLNYTRARSAGLSNTMENWHTYEIDWQEDIIEWFIDGEKVRSLEKNSTYNETSKEYSYPQTPCRIQMSLWPGGNETNAPGTIEWAGGKIDWNAQDIKDNGYYYAYLKNVTVKAYDLPSNVGQQKKNNSTDFDAYIYNDTSGWADVIMVTNEGTLLGDDDATGFDRKIKKKSSSSSSSSSSKSNSSSKTSSGSSNSKSTSTGKSGSGNDSSNSNSNSNSNSATSSQSNDFSQFDSSSSSSSKGDGAIQSVSWEKFGAIIGAIGMGFISFLI